MKYELPKLDYDYGALEPYIDAKTMEIHHTKHHQTYVTKLNEALDKHPELYEIADQLNRHMPCRKCGMRKWSPIRTIEKGNYFKCLKCGAICRVKRSISSKK